MYKKENADTWNWFLNLLKDELLHEINNIINETGASKKPEVIRNNVKQVLFTTFVIK